MLCAGSAEGKRSSHAYFFKELTDTISPPSPNLPFSQSLSLPQLGARHRVSPLTCFTAHAVANSNHSLVLCVTVSEIFISFIILWLFLHFTFTLNNSSIHNILCFFWTYNYKQHMHTISLLFCNSDDLCFTFSVFKSMSHRKVKTFIL